MVVNTVYSNSLLLLIKTVQEGFNQPNDQVTLMFQAELSLLEEYYSGTHKM